MKEYLSHKGELSSANAWRYNQKDMVLILVAAGTRVLM